MDPIHLVFSIAVLILSVIAHEVSHGAVAYALGDPTAKLAGRLTLNPARHFDLMGSFVVPVVTFLLGGIVFGWAKPVPYNPYNLRKGKWGAALVAAAGPATNLLIAFSFGLLLRFGAQGFLGSLFSAAFLNIASSIVLMNIVLAVFNIVPVPPLDGSKVLFALLPYRFLYVQEFLERNGLIVLIFFVFFLWRFVAPLIFLIFSFMTRVGV